MTLRLIIIIILFTTVNAYCINRLTLKDSIIKRPYIKWSSSLETGLNKALAATEVKTLNHSLTCIIPTNKKHFSAEIGTTLINRVDIYSMYSYAERHPFLGMPINLKYHNNIFYTSFGLLSEISLLKKTKFRPDNMNRKINFGANLQCGIDKEINKRLSIFMEIRYSFIFYTVLKKRHEIYYSYENYGLGLGLLYRL